METDGGKYFEFDQEPTMNANLSISIVTYNNKDTIARALTSIENSTIKPYVVVVDNGSIDGTVEMMEQDFPNLTLIKSTNVGFGAGHNQAITLINGKSKFHLVMNPDIYFPSDTLESLLEYLKPRKDIGLVMPKILYPDNQIQHLCKLLPTPFDLIGRRFLPGILKPLIQNRLDRYEMKDRDYNTSMEVPHLSGCFMMLRAEVFQQVGGFDERFFMYLEDVDFSRRIHARYKTLYFPGTFVYHQYHKGSYKGMRHLKYHIASAIKYFNKWGWFWDKERRAVNKAISI
jgi:GT2 family glycosyltransferase